jgi:hypothetical protein
MATATEFVMDIGFIRPGRDPEVRQQWHRARQERAAVFSAVLAAIGAFLWFGRPAPSWAQVAEAMRARPWIRATAEIEDGLQHEFWIAPQRGVSASRRGERVQYHDHALRLSHIYEPDEKRLYRLPDASDHFWNEFRSFSTALEGIFRGEAALDSPTGDEVVEQSRRWVEDAGDRWIEYELVLRRLSREPGREATWRLLFRVDPESRLPRSMTIRALTEVIEFTFEYPEQGPVDIHALDVPRDVELVDRVPPEDLDRLLAANQVGRVRFDDYHAVVVETFGADQPWRSINLYRVWRSGNRWRFERGSVKPTYRHPEPPVPGTDMVAWWKEQYHQFDFIPLAVCDGETVYRSDLAESNRRERVWSAVHRIAPDLQPGEAFKSSLPIWHRMNQFMPEFFGYPDLQIPRQHFEGRLDPRPDQGPEGTVLLNIRATRDHGPWAFRNFRYWMDPARDYVSVQFEWDGATGPDGEPAPAESFMIQEVERSPQGIWYPTVVHDERRDSRKWFYLDFDAEFPDELFKPVERPR